MCGGMGGGVLWVTAVVKCDGGEWWLLREGGDGNGDVELGWLLCVAVAGAPVSLAGVRRTLIMGA